MASPLNKIVRFANWYSFLLFPSFSATPPNVLPSVVSGYFESMDEKNDDKMSFDETLQVSILPTQRAPFGPLVGCKLFVFDFNRNRGNLAFDPNATTLSVHLHSSSLSFSSAN